MWTNSRYVKFLEGELAHCRQRHAAELETLKKNHAEELSRAITEANRGWAEADRLRQFLVPGLPQSTRATETPESTPTKPEKVAEAVEQGQTPFQRYAAREYQRQKDEADAAKAAEALRKAKEVFPTAPAKPV